VLVDQRLGPFGESSPVLIGPPVIQCTIAVILGTLIIKAVTDFVANDRADTAKVLCRCRIRGEKRRLQDSSREDNGVFQRRVVSITRLRAHVPLFWIRALFDLGKVM